eukprot:403360260
MLRSQKQSANNSPKLAHAKHQSQESAQQSSRSGSGSRYSYFASAKRLLRITTLQSLKETLMPEMLQSQRRNENLQPEQELVTMTSPEQEALRSRYSQKSKRLPSDFAEKVLELEMQLEQSHFQEISIEVVEQLLYLYSQAVEYYNGLNNEKYQQYADRIQNTLVRPEVIKIMAQSKKLKQNKSPNSSHIESSQIGLNQIQRSNSNNRTSGPPQNSNLLLKHRLLPTTQSLIQEEHVKRQRQLERKQKMRENYEDISGQGKLNIMFQEQDQLRIRATEEIKRDQQSQSENLKRRLAERKLNLTAKRSMNSSIMQDSLSDNSGFMSRPDSTKNSNGSKQIKFDEDAFNNISLIKGLSTQDCTQNFDNSPIIDEEEQQDYEDSMHQIWSNCEHLIEQLSQTKAQKIEQLIEELTIQKYEKFAEIKSAYDFMIKKLESKKLKQEAEAKRKEKEQELQNCKDEFDQLKKSKISELEKEYELKKSEIMQQKIQRETRKLVQANKSRANSRGSSNNSRISLRNKNKKVSGLNQNISFITPLINVDMSKLGVNQKIPENFSKKQQIRSQVSSIQHKIQQSLPQQ